MGTFFKRNDFRTDYQKRPHDENKALLDKLDDETKRKFALQRALILAGVVFLVVIGIIILAVTGIGTNPTNSAGSILDSQEAAKISFLGDLPSDGISDILTEQLKGKLKADPEITGYTVQEETIKNTSYKQIEKKPDIVILQMLYSNCEAGEDPEGILEANIDGLLQQECLVYLVNYPYVSDAEQASAAKRANQYIAKASQGKSILLLDAASYFQDLTGQGTTEELFLEDGIRLTETGKERMGEFIAGGLLSDAGLE